MRTTSALQLTLAASASALVSPDGVGRLPAMGWNSWNEYECNINETVFLEVAHSLKRLGLQDLGYEYVNIDDCWSDKVKRRDNTTNRIIVDSEKFPKGIGHVADQVHDLGLKLGIYSDAGPETCGGYEGSLGYEDIDAETFSSWGIDYLKYDNCPVPHPVLDEYPYDPVESSPEAPAGYDYGTSNTAKRYKAMRDALVVQNRTIQFSLCVWGFAHVEQWGNETGHSWRMLMDIWPMWTGTFELRWGLMPLVNQAAHYWNTTGFWGHNDWDMLEVGNGNLTYEENRSHFALWAAFKSPLIIGTKLSTITEPILEILSNKELIDFNQDAHYSDGIRPFNYETLQKTTEHITHPPDHWVGTSTKGIHLFLLNADDEDKEVVVKFSDVPGLRSSEHKEFLVHDMWTGEDLGSFEDEVAIDVKTHDTAALRLTTVDGKHPIPEWTPTSDQD